MGVRKVNPEATWQTISVASRQTGLSCYFLRNGCINGTVPHIKVGREYKINMELLRKQLSGEVNHE